MPQVIRSTSTPTGVSGMAAIISNLRSTMVAGGAILAADVTALINLYNTWAAHTHTANDLRGVATVLPGGGYSTSGTYTTSTSSVSGTSVPSTGGAQAPVFTPFPILSLPSVGANGTISATDTNAVITRINAALTHQHTINDVTG